MNIFTRIAEQRKAHCNVTFLERPVTTRDLYLSPVVVIDFLVGQELFFYIFKCKHKTIEKHVLTLKELQDITSEETNAISIHFKDLKEKQFKKEYEYIKNYINIQNYIKQVGGDNVK